MAVKLVEGLEFSGRTRQLTMARMLALSGGELGSAEWPRKNVHTDATKAADAGFHAPIASGIHREADIVRLLIDLFGEGWLRHGKLSVNHLCPVFAGTWVQPRARVRARKPGEAGDILELDVWCETPEKVIVTAGTASCREELNR